MRPNWQLAFKELNLIPPHPAKFSDVLVPYLAGLLIKYHKHNLLDPMAGTGKVALVRKYGYQGRITCNDLEKEWESPCYKVDQWLHTDAASLPFPDGSFDAIVTSPPYGNRLADHHQARDDSERFSYAFCLGHPLHPENTGQMQWGVPYREKQVAIYRECYRLLQDGGLFLINVSDFIKQGQEVQVTTWTAETLTYLGFWLREQVTVPTRRLRMGRNSTLRASYETILTFGKPGTRT